MNRNRSIIGMVVMLALVCSGGASEFSDEIWASYKAGALEPTEIFRVREGVELHYFAPANARAPGNNVAHIYIHGGSFRGGSPRGFYRWSRYLAEHGVSAFALKYRLLDRKKRGKPTICVEDAKSAMRWLRANAEKLGVDPERIAVGGNSAGGHLAAALATLEGHNHPADDLSIKTTPNLLLLGSPALDLGGYFGKDISPVHNLNENLPNTIAIIGDSDRVIPMKTMEIFGLGVIDAGSDFEWWVFPGKGHGLTAQNKSYLTPELMHIYFSYFNFLAQNGYVDEPLPAGDEVRTLIQQRKLGE
ncbi:alpha/beta hydrolase [Pelagicoccus mobilis]|uniref:Alpha/beta hydrolase n=1 Tax=Pelagicoccus mobilis TaxID=415221 RepID=A0A934S1W2_9BACT|nr:alpha/beta hydrolase [Pelagicoccus mobilis]MBK1879645.1 alpha/beta hydrolase [Pelagicoccus mobilis]